MALARSNEPDASSLRRVGGLAISLAVFLFVAAVVVG